MATYQLITRGLVPIVSNVWQPSMEPVERGDLFYVDLQPYVVTEVTEGEEAGDFDYIVDAQQIIRNTSTGTRESLTDGDSTS